MFSKKQNKKIAFLKQSVELTNHHLPPLNLFTPRLKKPSVSPKMGKALSPRAETFRISNHDRNDLKFELEKLKIPLSTQTYEENEPFI